jgi:hypothetical protein
MSNRFNSWTHISSKDHYTTRAAVTPPHSSRLPIIISTHSNTTTNTAHNIIFFYTHPLMLTLPLLKLLVCLYFLLCVLLMSTFPLPPPLPLGLGLGPEEQLLCSLIPFNVTVDNRRDLLLIRYSTSFLDCFLFLISGCWSLPSPLPPLLLCLSLSAGELE